MKSLTPLEIIFFPIRNDITVVVVDVVVVDTVGIVINAALSLTFMHTFSSLPVHF